METHHQSFFTAPLWQEAWYAIGYGILFSADVGAYLASEYRRLQDQEIISPYHADDACITALATGVYPYEGHVFQPCPALPPGVRQLMCLDSLKTKRISQYGALLHPAVSLEESINYCEQSKNLMLVRTRNGYDLDILAEFYEYLLRKSYPKLSFESLVEYAKSLPTTKEKTNYK